MDKDNELVTTMFQGMDRGAKAYGANMSSHMPVLYILAQRWSFAQVVELGVGGGWSTTALLAGVLAAGRRLISYDIKYSTRDRALEAMKLKPDDPRLASWEFRMKRSLDAAGDFKDGSVSLWFLDTTHSYGDTKNEIAAWFPKIHPEGVMCGHDYYLHVHPQWVKISGVNRAVDEFAEAHAGRFSLQVLPNDMGFFILWPKEKK